MTTLERSPWGPLLPTRLRLLVAHNRYVSSQPSGENNTVAEVADALRAVGVDVQCYIRESDEIARMSLAGKATLPLGPVYSRSAVHQFRQAIRDFRPHVVQLHNPYPLISPAVVRVAAQAGVPVVNYVHNYRHVCMNGTLFRNGHDCTECVGRTVPWPGTRHGCYQESRLRSSVMTAALGIHATTWQQVTRFVAISEHVRRVLMDSGFPPNESRVVPNAVEDPGPSRPVGHGFVFAGRMDEPKGADLLLDAWEASGLGATTTLDMVGDGPRRHGLAARGLAGVRFHGQLSKAATAEVLAAAAVVVVPSIWQEPFGRTAVEALAHGRGVIATRVGGLREIVTPEVGVLCDPDAGSMAAALRHCAGADARTMGQAARLRYQAMYSRRRQVEQLLALYTELAGAESSGPRP